MLYRSRFLVLLTALALVMATASAGVAQTGSGGGQLDTAAFADSAARMSQLGMVKGRADGNLALNDSITRAELVTILVRAFGKEDIAKQMAGAAAYPDTANHWVSGYAAAAKTIAEEKGMSLGRPDGTFDPNAQLSAAEAIAFMMKFLGLSPDPNTSWPDNYLEGAVQAGMIARSDGDKLKGALNSSANRGLAFFLADSGFSKVSMKETGKTLYQTKTADSIPPEITVDPYPNAVTTNTVMLSGTSKDAYVIRVGDTRVKPGADGRWQASVRLQLGLQTVEVVAADLAGNVASPATPVQITYSVSPVLVFTREGTVWAVDVMNLDQPYQISPDGTLLLVGDYNTFDQPVVSEDGEWVYYTRKRSQGGWVTNAIVRSRVEPVNKQAGAEAADQLVIEFPGTVAISDLAPAPGGGVMFEQDGQIKRVKGGGAADVLGKGSGYRKPAPGLGDWLLVNIQGEVQVQGMALPVAKVAALCGDGEPQYLTGTGTARVVNFDPAALPDGSGFIYSDTMKRRLVVQTWAGDARVLEFEGLWDQRMDVKPVVSSTGVLAFEMSVEGPPKIVIVANLNSTKPLVQLDGQSPAWGRFPAPKASQGPCQTQAPLKWEKAQ